MTQLTRRKMEKEARDGTLHVAVDCRTHRVLVDEIQSRVHRKDSVRQTERKIGNGTRHNVRRGNVVEEETSWRCTGKTHMHVWALA